MMPLVYIVILNYKKWQDVVECLASVFRLKYDNYRVFVIDNDSQNNSLEHLIEWVENSSAETAGKRISYKYLTGKGLETEFNLSSSPELVFVQNDENKGFAGGNNVVLQHLIKKDAYIWLLNPDMVVEQEALSELVSFAGRHPFKSIIGSLVKFYADAEKVHLYGGARIDFNSATVDLVTDVNDIPRIDFICGGSMFTHSGHFKELGLLPEEYFLYWEETDWCYRAKQKDYNMLVCTTAVCYDKISSTIGKSSLADYYYTRNGLLFTAKFREKKIPIALVSAFLRLLKRLLSGQWDRSKGVYRGILTFLNRKK